MSAALPWWKQGAIYQIYPRSFCDSNGDGIGDLPGIISKLDYLQALGIAGVWLSPVYASPQRDNGYDISDYRAIAPEFGSMADFDELLAGLHQRGIKLIMDLVVNHTSDQHHWFQQACLSRDNPYHDYYIWHEPVAGREPNNWESVFSGPAWTFNAATGEYYLHLFAPEQPDLNWENPALRQEVYALMRFWLDKGVDGFRMDVINLIAKPATLPDAPVVKAGFYQPCIEQVANGLHLAAFLDEMKREVLAHYDCMTVGETPLVTPQHGLALTHQQTGALNMVFQFEHMDLDCQPGGGKWALKPLDLPDVKASISRWQTGLQDGGWNSLYLSNHDQPRPVSRFGDDGVYRVASAKMLATCLHFLRGTPFIYQGEELGMTNVRFDHIEDYRDLETLNWYREAVSAGMNPAAALNAIHAKGRDNARTPMQWNAIIHAGFGKGVPWLAVNPKYVEINAEQAENDPDSVLHYYRRLIALRKTEPLMTTGRYRLLLDNDPHVFAYLRESHEVAGNTQPSAALLIVCNFDRSTQTRDWPVAGLTPQTTLLIANQHVEQSAGLGSMRLKPFEARVYRV